MKSTKAPKHFKALSTDTWFMLPTEFRLEFRYFLAERFGYRCVFCGKPFEFDRLTVDHILPISKGGPVCDLGNMRLLCFQCHKERHGL